MAEKNNLSLDIGICDKELSESENNIVLEKKSYDKSVTRSNILPSDTRISESKHEVTVSNRDDYNLDVKDTAQNKTEEKEKEINIVIKSLKEDSSVEYSIDSSELSHNNVTQIKAIENEVESETVVSGDNCDNSGIIQTEIKEKMVKRQDCIETCFENKQCTGSSDFSLENTLNNNDQIETISNEQHGSSESMHITTAHANQIMKCITSIETNNGAQTCEYGIDSSELSHNNVTQIKAIENEVESETVVSGDNCDNSGIIQTEIKEKMVKRQDCIETCFENKQCTGSSDFSLENTLNNNDQIETISNEQHGTSESMHITTAHANQTLKCITSIETNNGAQTCEIMCSSTKFPDESSKQLQYDGCNHLIATEASQIKPETKFPISKFKQKSDQLTLRKKNRKKCASETLVNPQRRHIAHSADGLVYCNSHNEVVKYWCQKCGIAKCEKCVNVVYSRTCINHVVTTIKEHVIETKEVQRKKIEDTSNICLMALDRAIRVLQRNEQQTELQALIQKDRIRQEFASFYKLLIEEERTVLDDIEMSLEDYRTQNRSCEQLYGSVVEYEAGLMSKSLSLLEKEDPFGINSNMIEKYIQTDWLKIPDNVNTVTNSIPPMPAAIKNKFTLLEQKVDTMKQLSNARDPFEIFPLNFTLYLDDDCMASPIKVSDLFICKNTTHIFPTAVLDIEVLCSRIVVYKEILKMYDYILNFDGKPRLMEGNRYLIKARLLDKTRNGAIIGDMIMPACRNVLLITGKRKRNWYKFQRYEDAVSYMEDIRRQYMGKYPTFSERNSLQFLHWCNSKMWNFSAAKDFKGFYDVSPEEMRMLAYSTDKHTYSTFQSLLLTDVQKICFQAENISWKFDTEEKSLHEIEAFTNMNRKIKKAIKKIRR